MAIRDKSPREQAALHFKAAGLGDRSAREAARLLFETGISFESAAVLGQCAGEPVAVVAKVREEADRYRRAGEGPRTTSAWGRPVAEVKPSSAAPSPEATAQPAVEGRSFARPERTKVVDGVLHHAVDTYVPVATDTTTAGNGATESAPTRSAWGRPLTEQKGA